MILLRHQNAYQDERPTPARFFLRRDWWSVDLGHKKATEHNFVEFGIGSTGQKPVQLYKKSQIDVFGLGRSPADLSVFIMSDIYTLEWKKLVLIRVL